MFLIVSAASIITLAAAALLLPPPQERYPHLRNLSLATIFFSSGIITALLIGSVKEPYLAALVLPIAAGGSVLFWLSRFDGDDGDDDGGSPLDWDALDRERSRWRPLIKS